MIPLRQSTASQEIPLGTFVSSTDGDTERTALTIANTDIKLWKHGASALANKNSGGATHMANGNYVATLDATDTNTLGGLVLIVHVATALPVKLECVVLAADVYDSIVAGTAPAEVTGRPTTWFGMLRRAFEWKGNKRTRNRTTGSVVLRNAADDGTLETQTQSTVAPTDTQTQGV